MKLIEAISKRRSYYDLKNKLPLPKEEVFRAVEKITELVPDAFNMKSSRVVILTGEKHKQVWDLIYDCFKGEVKREKIDSFKSAYGTILYFIDLDVVSKVQARFPKYHDKFTLWTNQAAGMLQFSIWTALREVNIGASLQHYNPIIDQAVKEFLDLPESWELNAQMPFGAIASEPEAKDAEDISKRVKIFAD